MKEFLHNTWKHRAHVIMSLPAVLILFFFQLCSDGRSCAGI